MKPANTKDLSYYWDKFRRHPLNAIQDGLYILGIKIIPFFLYEEGIQAGLVTGYQALPDGVGIRPLNPDDMKIIANMPERDRSKPVLQRRLAAGNLCIGAFHGKKLVAFTWCNLKECIFPGYRFTLKSDAAYLYDAYTLPSHRGTGLAPTIRYHTYIALASRGRTRFYSFSNRLNAPAIRFKQKLNAKIIASGLYINLFSRWYRVIGSKKQLS